MKDHDRQAALEQIRRHIEESGHHVYFVLGESHPCFGYTIGLHETLGYELLFAGGADYVASEIAEVLNVLAKRIKEGRVTPAGEYLLGDLGGFTLRDAHVSWAGELLLGAYDYYDTDKIAVRQVVPDTAHWTIDVPDTSIEWNATTQPIWKHLYEPWTYAFAPDSTATTDLAALHGQKVTRALRKEDGWELFAEADVKPEDVRRVPLSTLLAADPGLLPVASLAPGKGLYRSGGDQPWVAARVPG